MHKTPIGVGDVFELRVYREKELTGIHRVSIDGTVDIPLVGRIRVEQLSRDEVVDLLRSKLEQFIKAPQVSIFVKERKSKRIFVFGQVKKPGTFEFESNMNIIQAITLAGGFDKLADQNGAYVNRIIEGQEKRIEVSVKDIGRGQATNFLLQAGDIVYIPESIFFGRCYARFNFDSCGLLWYPFSKKWWHWIGCSSRIFSGLSFWKPSWD